MPLKTQIAIKLYVTLAILFFTAYCFYGFSGFGHFAAKENWTSLLKGLVFGAGNAIVPTGLVMLGFWSNSWFQAGSARRAERRLQKYSGSQEHQNGR